VGSEGCTFMCKKGDLDNFYELRFWKWMDGFSMTDDEAPKRCLIIFSFESVEIALGGRLYS